MRFSETGRQSVAASVDNPEREFVIIEYGEIDEKGDPAFVGDHEWRSKCYYTSGGHFVDIVGKGEYKVWENPCVAAVCKSDPDPFDDGVGGMTTYAEYEAFRDSGCDPSVIKKMRGRL